MTELEIIIASLQILLDDQDIDEGLQAKPHYASEAYMQEALKELQGKCKRLLDVIKNEK